MLQLEVQCPKFPPELISINEARYSWGKKTSTSYFWGVYGNTSSPPAAATTVKTPAKTAAASGRRRARGRVAAAVFAGVFAVVAAAEGLEVFPYTPQKWLVGVVFPQL